MSKNDTNGDKACVKKPRAPQADNGVKFTPMTARQAQEASVRARNLRKQVRAQMLNKLVANMDFADEMLKAVKRGDLKQIELIQTALKIVGLTHDQSEEVVNKIQLDANVDAKSDVAAKIEFVLPKPEASDGQHEVDA